MKKTLTIMALLAALGAVPQGVAQTQDGTAVDPQTGSQGRELVLSSGKVIALPEETMTLTAGEQQHLLFTPEEGKSIQEGIRVQGDVKFQNLSSSDKILGGAAISIDPGTVAAEHHIAFFGDGKEGDDRLSFLNNVHQYNKLGDEEKTACGGAIGTCSDVSASTNRPIELTFADLAEVLFSGNQHGGEGDTTCAQLKGGSIAAHYINFVNVGKVTIEGGDLEALNAKQNAYYSGAFTADGVLVENVDDFSVVNNVTKSAYRGSTIYLSGGVTNTDPTSVAREFRITNCGEVTFSGNQTVLDPEWRSVMAYDRREDKTEGSVMYLERVNAEWYGNGSITISNNYVSNKATLKLHIGNIPGQHGGYFNSYLNGDFNFVDNRAGMESAALEVLVVEQKLPGRVMLSADLGDVTFRGNIGGVNQPIAVEENSKRADPMQNVATAILYTGYSSPDRLESSLKSLGDFRAMEGHSVHFYDPMRVQLDTKYSDTQMVRLQYNAPLNEDDPRDQPLMENYLSYWGETPEYKGAIHFSGEYYREVDHDGESYLQKWEAESDERFARRLLLSRWSTVLAHSFLYGGEMIVENGAIYGETEDSLNVKYEYREVKADQNGAEVVGQELSIAETPDGDAWQFAEDTKLDVQKGALAIRTDGIVIAKNISFSGHDAMLRMDDTARIIADRVDLTKGVSVDFNHALEHGVKIAMLSDAGTKSHQLVHAKLTVTANSLDMGTTFTLGVPDHTTATPGEFYSGEAWKGDLTFAVLDVSHVLDKGGVASGDNLSIVSVASVSADTGEGTNLVAYEGGSQGEWSIHWGEGDDDQYVLYAEWKNTDPDDPDEPDEPGTDEPDEPGADEPDEPGTDEPDEPGTGDTDDPGTGDTDDPGTDEPDEPGTGDTDEPGDGDSTPAVDPGRVGVAVENSLWSTKGNAEQLQRAALAQVTAFRFMDHRATRLWGSVLGEYDRVNGSAGADGYEYSGEGYAVGMDRVWKNRYLLGAGFGQMFGKNRGRSLPDVIKQDSVMATVYGAAVQKLSDRDSLTYEGSLTLGWTDNEMSSWQSAVSPAHGDWDSKALLLKGDVIWSRRLSERSVLGLTAGLEFGRAWREGFTETGIGERRFDRSSLTVLSMPIGCSWTHESGIGGKPWVNTLYVAYVPDLYREDPKSAARDGQQAWEVRGVAPGRHALRVGYGTQWAVSESCTLYAGYSFEYRETAAYHNVNAGVSVAF